MGPNPAYVVQAVSWVLFRQVASDGPSVPCSSWAAAWLRHHWAAGATWWLFFSSCLPGWWRLVVHVIHLPLLPTALSAWGLVVGWGWIPVRPVSVGSAGWAEPLAEWLPGIVARPVPCPLRHGRAEGPAKRTGHWCHSTQLFGLRDDQRHGGHDGGYDEGDHHYSWAWEKWGALSLLYYIISWLGIVGHYVFLRKISTNTY